MNVSQFFGAVTLCLSSVCSLANQADIVIEIDSRSAIAVTEASPFSTVISRQEIIESGYLSLSEVLASSGVLHINGASSGYSASGTPDMRGFGERAAQNVLIMLDGRPLNNATLESPDLSTIPLQVPRDRRVCSPLTPSECRMNGHMHFAGCVFSVHVSCAIVTLPPLHNKEGCLG